ICIRSSFWRLYLRSRISVFAFASKIGRDFSPGIASTNAHGALAPEVTELTRTSLATSAALSFALGAASFVSAQPPAQTAAPTQQTWRFDNLASLGGHPTKILGTPQLIDTPAGKAVAFNGTDSALFVNEHPLAGAATWTWEMVFRPDPDGKPEQRVFHLQSVDPATGQERTLLNCEKLHPFGPWYRVTAVYDGKMLRNYVDAELQGEGPLSIPPERPGRASAGTRINLVDYYKGAIYSARFTPRALTPDEFLKNPLAGK